MTAQPFLTLPLSTILSYPLQKANYPQVNFWTKKDWLESEEFKKAESGSHRKGHLSKGINVRMRYIEMAEGIIVDGFKASEMRAFARSIWLSFTELHIELDWKADQVATQIYSGWYGKWLKRQEVQSDSDSEEDVPPAIGPADSKCSHVDSMAPATKRLRQDLPVSCALPLSEQTDSP